MLRKEPNRLLFFLPSVQTKNWRKYKFRSKTFSEREKKENEKRNFDFCKKPLRHLKKRRNRLKRGRKGDGRKGYMAQNITTSQVINEHCSCCHGNYYHSNVANGIRGRAREICENYCQIQLGSFRLNSAGRPAGPSLISYQIERRMVASALETPRRASHQQECDAR